MIGGAGVGKTSLVRRCVERVFSERCLSTIGVKIDRKLVVGIDEVHMVHWHIGEETDLRSILRLKRLNSADQGALAPAGVAPLAAKGWTSVRTSAVNGLGVEGAVRHLAARLLPEPI
jgi:hypothetical protein